MQEKQPTDYTPAFLIACAELHHLEFIAGDFVKSAKLLFEQRNSSDYAQSFHLLCSLAFEIYPKVLIAYDICLKYQDNTEISTDELRNLIFLEHKKVGHNIKSLFELFPELIKELEIEEISKVPDKTDDKEWFVNEYRFKIKDYDYLISIKDVEAVRYGSFSKDRDIALDCTDDEKTLELLLKLQNFVRDKQSDAISKMKQVY